MMGRRDRDQVSLAWTRWFRPTLLPQLRHPLSGADFAFHVSQVFKRKSEQVDQPSRFIHGILRTLKILTFTSSSTKAKATAATNRLAITVGDRGAIKTPESARLGTSRTSTIEQARTIRLGRRTRCAAVPGRHSRSPGR